MDKDSNIWKRILIYGCGIIVVLGCILFLIGNRNLQEHPYSEAYSEEEPFTVTIPLSPEISVVQSFVNHADDIKGVYLRFATYGFEMTEGEIQVALQDDQKVTLRTASIPFSEVIDNKDIYFQFSDALQVDRNKKLHLILNSTVTDGTNYVALWIGKKIDDSELTIESEQTTETMSVVPGELSENTLYMDLDSYRNAHFVFRFCVTVGGTLLFFVLLCIKGMKDNKNGKLTPTNELVHIFDKYTFLLKELVGRDFAVKYRRSYLGFLWVILNPLLTMIVMSTVFSYIFKLQIEYYSVYLILGNIVFSCFSEATQLAAQSVVTSGQMIKKVYIPKYIFPLSKTLFSFFNFLLTLIPALCVIIYYRVPFTVNYLLLPIVLIGLFLFAFGVGMFLASWQVFMRDVQYLYSIFLTLWMYLTPLWYSEDSLAPVLRKIMQFNPMYIYISCMRKIMLYGITPTVIQLALCVWMGIIAMLIGQSSFFKKQKRFILFI